MMNPSYKVLGLSARATKEQIKQAYRKLALKFHPDKHTNSPQNMKDDATLKFKEATTAYENLMNNNNYSPDHHSNDDIDNNDQHCDKENDNEKSDCNHHHYDDGYNYSHQHYYSDYSGSGYNYHRSDDDDGYINKYYHPYAEDFDYKHHCSSNYYSHDQDHGYNYNHHHYIIHEYYDYIFSGHHSRAPIVLITVTTTIMTVYAYYWVAADCIMGAEMLGMFQNFYFRSSSLSSSYKRFM
ncbi:hypothetical protein C1H46_002022 [Malus baccata]|uniref:J domain-containing protein n=1 Tax=Malus baccata TaxID=106549 RepID=A0A540NMW6_MALBA|nr:hypothetical protein C1H46_002022 [Malus baccata]